MRKVGITYMDSEEPGKWKSKVFHVGASTYGEADKRIKDYVPNHMDVTDWFIEYNRPVDKYEEPIII